MGDLSARNGKPLLGHANHILMVSTVGEHGLF